MSQHLPLVPSEEAFPLHVFDAFGQEPAVYQERIGGSVLVVEKHPENGPITIMTSGVSRFATDTGERVELAVEVLDGQQGAAVVALRIVCDDIAVNRRVPPVGVPWRNSEPFLKGTGISAIVATDSRWGSPFDEVRNQAGVVGHVRTLRLLTDEEAGVVASQRWNALLNLIGSVDALLDVTRSGLQPGVPQIQPPAVPQPTVAPQTIAPTGFQAVTTTRVPGAAASQGLVGANTTPLAPVTPAPQPVVPSPTVLQTVPVANPPAPMPNPQPAQQAVSSPQTVPVPDPSQLPTPTPTPTPTSAPTPSQQDVLMRTPVILTKFHEQYPPRWLTLSNGMFQSVTGAESPEYMADNSNHVIWSVENYLARFPWTERFIRVARDGQTGCFTDASGNYFLEN